MEAAGPTKHAADGFYRVYGARRRVLANPSENRPHMGLKTPAITTPAGSASDVPDIICFEEQPMRSTGGSPSRS